MRLRFCVTTVLFGSVSEMSKLRVYKEKGLFRDNVHIETVSRSSSHYKRMTTSTGPTHINLKKLTLAFPPELNFILLFEFELKARRATGGTVRITLLFSHGAVSKSTVCLCVCMWGGWRVCMWRGVTWRVGMWGGWRDVCVCGGGDVTCGYVGRVTWRVCMWGGDVCVCGGGDVCVCGGGDVCVCGGGDVCVCGGVTWRVCMWGGWRVCMCG